MSLRSDCWIVEVERQQWYYIIPDPDRSTQDWPASGQRGGPFPGMPAASRAARAHAGSFVTQEVIRYDRLSEETREQLHRLPEAIPPAS